MSDTSSVSQSQNPTNGRAHRLKDLRRSLLKVLYSRTILCLTVLFGLAVVLSLLSVSHLTEGLIRIQALQNARLYANALTESRSLYSDEAVKRVVLDNQVRATHDYTMHPGAIPLPATFLIELGERIREGPSDLAVRLYSDYPFPWRGEQGGPKNAFEQEALASLRQDAKQPFFRLERNGSKLNISVCSSGYSATQLCGMPQYLSGQSQNGLGSGGCTRRSGNCAALGFP